MQVFCLISVVPAEPVVTAPDIGALAVRELIHDRPWTLASGHHHRGHRNEIILLDKLFRVYQI